jgi:biotin synthase-like enzyme
MATTSSAASTAHRWGEQTQRAIDRFWRQVLVSAVNEELDRMAASHGLHVFRQGFLAGANSIFYGDKLLTTANNDVSDDLALIEEAGLRVGPADSSA